MSERLRQIGRTFRDAGTIMKTYPHLMIALMPPFGFVASVRRWVMDRIAEEEAYQKLRAVVPPDEWEATLARVDQLYTETAETYRLAGYTPPDRIDVIQCYFQSYIITGEHP